MSLEQLPLDVLSRLCRDEATDHGADLVTARQLALSSRILRRAIGDDARDRYVALVSRAQDMACDALLILYDQMASDRPCNNVAAICLYDGEQAQHVWMRFIELTVASGIEVTIDVRDLKCAEGVRWTNGKVCVIDPDNDDAPREVDIDGSGQVVCHVTALPRHRARTAFRALLSYQCRCALLGRRLAVLRKYIVDVLSRTKREANV